MRHCLSAFVALSVGLIGIASLPSDAAAQQGTLIPATPKPPAVAPGTLAVTTQANVTFIERGEKKLTADFYLPEGPGPFPGVLMVHGGAWVGGNSWNVIVHARYLASRGYVVMATNYRKAPKNVWPSQLDDCKAAVRFMRKESAQYKIDPDRLGAWGYSAGGQLVSLLATSESKDGLEGADAKPGDPSTRLQAVVAGGAPVDFMDQPPNSRIYSFFLGGTPREKPEAYRTASAASFVTRDDPPMFFFHGANDLLVRRGGVERLIGKLKEQGVEADLYIVPGVEHMGAFLSPSTMTKSVEFFDRVLKPGAGPARKE